MLTIASMVEREVSVPEERPLVAAVIYNRLRDGIPLGIDATLRFEQNDWVNPLKQSVLDADTPYNTRTRQGCRPARSAAPGSPRSERRPGRRQQSALLRRQAGDVRRARLLGHVREIQRRRAALQRRARGGRRQVADEMLSRARAVAHGRAPRLTGGAEAR